LNKEVIRQKLFNLPLAAQPAVAFQPEKSLTQADALIDQANSHEKGADLVSNPDNNYIMGEAA
jgi:hypothetical protein